MLPNVDECTAHLQLLHDFVLLRHRISQWASNTHRDSTETWNVFVQLAASRFVYYSQHMGLHGQLAHTLPLDVLMVWHAVLLNPAVAKDCGIDGFSTASLVCQAIVQSLELAC